MILYKWAKRWQVPPQAVTELVALMGVDYSQPPDTDGISEAAVQQQIRLDASRAGVRLWRNNNGATADESGRHIRYGLANDSPAVNKCLKSSDLIGITPRTITAGDVGSVVGVFTSIEVKRPGWVWSGTAREIAQMAWIQLIVSLGGIGKFATKREDWKW